MHRVVCSTYQALQANTSGYNLHKSLAASVVALQLTLASVFLHKLMDVHQSDLEIALWYLNTWPASSCLQLFSQQSVQLTQGMLLWRTHPSWVEFCCSTIACLCVRGICFEKPLLFWFCPHVCWSNEPKFSWPCRRPSLISSSPLVFHYVETSPTCKIFIIEPASLKPCHFEPIY